MEDTLIVEGLSTIEDIQNLEKRAIAENYKHYVGISNAGVRFGVKDGEVVKLGENEVADNIHYEEKVAPVVEEISVAEPVEEEVIDEIKECESGENVVETTENETEQIELSEEERIANNAKLAEFDIMVAKCAELETKNIELNDEIAKLNEQIDELTLKVNLAECHIEPEKVIELDDVCEFLKSHHISSIGIDKE